MRRRMTSDDAALAANWRAVLVGDAVLGIVLLVIAAVLAVGGSPVLGLLAAAIASANLAGLSRRYRRWKRLRAEAGLD